MPDYDPYYDEHYPDYDHDYPPVKSEYDYGFEDGQKCERDKIAADNRKPDYSVVVDGRVISSDTPLRSFMAFRKLVANGCQNVSLVPFQG